jgi:hypothetical protein
MANETVAEVMNASPRSSPRCASYTPEEAKARFRVAVSRVGPGRAIQRAPWKSVGLALGAGILLGYCRPLRQGLVKMGKFSLKGAMTAITHRWPGPLPEEATSTVDLGGNHSGSKCRKS